MENNTTTQKKLYCWLNLNTGKFSNSWDEESHKQWGPKENDFADAREGGWKLIEYTCLNDDTFQFYNQMKLK
jgi:hypothetical protein